MSLEFQELKLEKIEISALGVEVETIYSVVIPAKCHLRSRYVSWHAECLLQIEKSEVVILYAATLVP